MRRPENLRYMHIDGKNVRCIDDGTLQYVEFYDKDFHWDGEMVRVTAFRGYVYLYTGLEVRIIARMHRASISYRALYELGKDYLEDMKAAYDPREVIGFAERRIPELFI